MIVLRPKKQSLDRPATQTANPPPDHRPSNSAAISEAVVRLLRVSTGRGPTSASTLISPDLAVITLADCLTTAEQTLAAQGHAKVASRLRTALHEEIRSEAVATVEDVTGFGPGP